MKYINKDITTVGGRSVILHGCNDQNRMGSGVAKAIYTKWPEVKEKYHQYGDYCDREKLPMELGYVSFVWVKDDIMVLNGITQHKFGYDGNKYARPSAILKCLIKACEWCIATGFQLYIPRIGSGLGGLDWETEVVPLVNSVEMAYEMEIIVCDY